MSQDAPDREERAIRSWLRKRMDGAAQEQPLPAVPAHLPAAYRPALDQDDWFLRLYGPDGHSPIEPATSPDPDPDPADDDPEPEPNDEPAPRPRRERRALAEAAPNLSPRMRWLALHATAAAIGWPIGLVHWGTDTAAWFAAGHWIDGSAWALYGLAAAAVALYRRTRHALLLGSLLGAVPVSSVALGVLLYGAP